MSYFRTTMNCIVTATVLAIGLALSFDPVPAVEPSLTASQPVVADLESSLTDDVSALAAR